MNDTSSGPRLRNRNKEAIQLVMVLSLVFACHVSKHSMSNLPASGSLSAPDNLRASGAPPVPGSFPPFDKEGHRGCRGLMPENTIPAMLKALDLGVTTLEMDAHITRDSQVIISHDPYFNAAITTLPDGGYLDGSQEKNYVLYRMSYAETQRLDVGLKPYPKFPRQEKLAVHKPRLADLIDSVESYCSRHTRLKPFYNIETKSLPLTDHLYHPPPEEFVSLLMKVILSKGIRSRVIIQSFDPRTLRIIHREYPDMMTSLLIDDSDKRGVEAECVELGFFPTIYSPSLSLVDESLMKACHGHGMKVIPWTADDTETIERLRKLGVDGIITDYPDLF